MQHNTVKFLTQKELSRLFRVICKPSTGKVPYLFMERDYVMFQIAYYSALRASEVGLLRAEQYNPQTQELYCQRLKKTNNNTIRLDDTRAKLLKKYLKNTDTQGSDLIFVTRLGTAVSRRTLDYLIKNMGS